MKAIGPLKPVSRTTLSEQVASQLASELAAKRWHPGDKLPSEAELCRAFNVGRSTLREALKSLAFVGLIRMRAGGGSYVADQPSEFSKGRLLAKNRMVTEKDMRDLAEARLLLETELAGLCAQRATRHDLETLEDLVRKMEAAKNAGGIRFQQLYQKFHLSVAAGSKNQVLAELLGHIEAALQETAKKSLLSPRSTELACQQHQKILSALKQCNSKKARKAMHAHLIAFQQGYQVPFRKPPRSATGE